MNDISKEYIKRLIGKEDPVILDIGCYDGKDSAELARLFKSPEVHCFECDPRSVQLFRKLNYYPGASLYKLAICNKDGETSFGLSTSETRKHYDQQADWSASSSIKAPKTHSQLFPDVQFIEEIEVPCMKLDSWVKDNFDDREIIDFIWCDVNGAEADVVLGGLQTLNNHTRFLYIEVSDKELYEGQTTPDELLKMLPGFEFMKLYNYQGNFGNVLLKNKNL
jgi:2-O-methyltransferase